MAKNRLMRTYALSTCALLALAIAGCGSSGSTSSSSGNAASSSTQTSSSVSTQTMTTTSSTSTAAGTPACVASMLALSFLGGNGATGHIELGFALKNKSSSECHTYGYPGILFLAAGGQGLTTDTTRTTHDFFGSLPLKVLTVAPGQEVSFRIGTSDVTGSGPSCTTAHGLQVIPPDDTATLRVTLQNGTYECGTATVSPLQPGTTAFTNN
jgi:Protein of unknown function (DUF4232)